MLHNYYVVKDVGRWFDVKDVLDVSVNAFRGGNDDEVAFQGWRRQLNAGVV